MALSLLDMDSMGRLDPMAASISLITLLMALHTGQLNTDGSLSGTYSVPSTGEQCTRQVAPPSSGGTLSNSTWQGQGTYKNGQNPFDMLLTINVNGNAFTGTLTEDTYKSEVAISGSVNSSSSESVEITFTDPTSISGSQIALNCTYTVVISNGQMNGSGIIRETLHQMELLPYIKQHK
jgi:hypothetical protein